MSAGGAIPEGHVSVRLAVAGGRVRSASVVVRRPLGAVSALKGRTVAEALALVPLLFSVCGTAQGIAALSACEAALGLAPAPAHRAARTLLVLAETLASHAWQLFMDWPPRLGEPPDARRLTALRTATAGILPALYPARDQLRPGGGTLRPKREALAAAIAGLEALVADAIPAPLPADAGTLAGRIMRRALANPGFGVADVAPLPELPAPWFAERLSADPGFPAHPHLDGAPAYTGALARMAREEPVAGLLARHGAGLAAHVAARLAETAALPGRMAALLDEINAADAGTEHAAPGAGTGVVETARGRLAHWVRLTGGRIADCRIVAPTEWNFHPDGPLARGLTGVEAGPTLPDDAGLLVAAFDPCVAFSLDIARED